jgi:hypothetical protein
MRDQAEAAVRTGPRTRRLAWQDAAVAPGDPVHAPGRVWLACGRVAGVAS